MVFERLGRDGRHDNDHHDSSTSRGGARTAVHPERDTDDRPSVVHHGTSPEVRTADSAYSDAAAPTATTSSGPRVVEEQRVITKTAHTSVAAAFALGLGVLALFSALTAVLSPIAVIVGVIGVVLGVLGVKASRKVGVTGRGVALTGLVLSAIGTLLGATILVGVTTILNDESAVNRLENQVEQLRDRLPDDVDVDVQP